MNALLVIMCLAAPDTIRPLPSIVEWCLECQVTNGRLQRMITNRDLEIDSLYNAIDKEREKMDSLNIAHGVVIALKDKEAKKVQRTRWAERVVSSIVIAGLLFIIRQE